MRKTIWVSHVVMCALVLGACAKDNGAEGEDGANDTDPTETSDDGDEDSPPTTAEGADMDAGDGDGDDGDDGEDFVPQADFGGIADCDPIAQDCPMGEKCVAYASSGGTWDANKCVTVTGDGTAGDSCVYGGAVEGTDDCDEDHVCWNALEVDGQQIGTCFPFCTGDINNPICEDAAQTCRVVNDGVITVCLPRCDPLLQECTAGLGCYWSGTSQTFQCIITAGGIPSGEPCGFNNDCNPGNFCAAAEVLEECNGSACCAVFCDNTEDPDPCGAPLECIPFFEEGTAPPEYEDLGLCILPA